MKKLLFFFAIAASILCLSANKNIGTTLLVMLDPELPAQSFDYSFEVPAYTFDELGGPFAGSPNTADILDIDDDIATLGRVLFYDELLSSDQNIACATCHLQSKSFADEFAVSEGVNGETRRNSMQLNDLGWTNKSGFFWDMRALDLAEIIEIPLTDGNELGVVDFQEVANRLLLSNYYPDLFEKAYGDATDITQEKVIDALVHFISSITSFNTKFDQVMRDEDQFTTEEERGFDHFRSVCVECHFSASDYEDIFGSDPLFQVFPFFFANGSPETSDLGIGEFYPNQGLDHLFKIPTLRNIALTGPYMHDGRFETLEEVINHYSDDAVDDGWGFVPPGGFGFDDDVKAELLAFLHTLTDERMVNEDKWSDPFGVSNVNAEIDLTTAQIKLFPNPTPDILTVEIENPNLQMINAALISSNGQLVQKHSTHGSQLNANLNNVPAGLYMLQIKVGQQQTTRKVMVER